MIDMMKSIGIAKGSPFAPDEGAERILTDAATEGAGLAGRAIAAVLRGPVLPRHRVGVTGLD